nr:hypothetical protein 2 [ssRNA positive-strand virus sp.]
MEVATNNPFIKPNNNRAVNNYGITVMRSGQYVGMGFLESIFACYTNLVYKPISLSLVIFLLFIIAAEFNNSDGPIENMIKFLVKILENKDEPQIIKSIASLFLIIFKFLVKNKIYFVSVTFVWIPYASKPSRSNMIIALILSTFTIFGKHSFLEILLLSNCFYLYTELRTPWQKLIFALLGVVIFLVGMSNVANYLGLESLKYEQGIRNDQVYRTTPKPK